MALKDIWENKVDGVDDVLAEDINSIAEAVIELEEKPDVVVDNLMNGNSTNPVQNNIIVGFVNNKVKQTLESANDYTDTKIQELNISIDIDAEMSDTSTNAVQNKIVKTYIDESVGDAVETAENAQETANIAQANVQTVTVRLGNVETAIVNKADKPTITTSIDTALSFEFSANTNTEIRTGELTTISFTFGNGEYAEDYASGLSFDSGKTPTAIDYTDSGILNWVGTDCVTSDGLSIFQPSANTHYDIVFYFNGVQFIGLVNGFVPATGNEAV